MSLVASTLGVGRSTVYDRLTGATRTRGPYAKADDADLLPHIRQIASSNLAQLYNTTASPKVRVNDATYAQRENYWDAGFQQKIGNVTLGIDNYIRRSTNLVDEGQFGAPIILTPFNYGKGRIVGTELTFN